MIDALKFVQGAVSTKDMVPAMKYFRIEEGTVRAFNGILALCSPIDLDMACSPLATPTVKAITQCENVVSIGLTKANRLRIESGPFKTFVPCIEEPIPTHTPLGDGFEFDGEAFIVALKALLPFVGSDASREWANGILLRGQSAIATNNVCLVEYWLGFTMPHTMNIPLPAIKEILRIKEPPVFASCDGNSLTLFYGEGKWLRTQLYSTSWPDFERVFNQPGELQTLPDTLFDALKAIKPFAEKRPLIHFCEGRIKTTLSDEDGAAYSVPGLPESGAYLLSMLELLEGVAERANFASYPNPVPFQGGLIRGVILGQKL